MKITMTLNLDHLTFADLAEFSEAAARNGVRPDTVIDYDPEARTLVLSCDSEEVNVEDIPAPPGPEGEPGASSPAGERPLPHDVGEQVVNGVIEFLTGRRRPPGGGYGVFHP